MANRIQYRRDTAARWAEINPVLMEGEVGYETDTHRSKVGNGVDTYSNLEYQAGAENITQELGTSETLVVSQNLLNNVVNGNLSGGANKLPLIVIDDFLTIAAFNTWLDGIDFSVDNGQKYIGRCKCSLNGQNIEVYNFILAYAAQVGAQLIIGCFEPNSDGSAIQQTMSVNICQRTCSLQDTTTHGNWTKVGTEIDAELSETSENAVQNKVVTSGISVSSIFEKIEIGTVTDGSCLKGKSDLTISGRCVTDYIDISQYCGKTLNFYYAASFGDSNACQFYDAEKNYISALVQKGIYQKINIPNGVTYIRLSTVSSYKDKMILTYSRESSEISGIINLNDRISELENKTASIIGTTKNIYGEDDDSYALNSGGSALSSGFFIKLESKLYTKFKIYAHDTNTHTFSICRFDSNLGIYVPYTSISITPTTTGEVFEQEINVDLRNCVNPCMAISGYYNTYTGNQYSKIPFFKSYPGNNLYTAEEFETNCTQYSTTCFNFSLEYTEYGEQEENVGTETMQLSDSFYLKGYVAFGDSITVVPDSTHCWPMLIAKYFKMNLSHGGVSGSVPVASGTSNNNLTDSNLERVTSDTMLVTISGGQNKWVTADDIDSSDRSTSIGAINYYIDQIREISPTCIIVLCPTYIGTSNGAKTQCALDYAKIAANKHVGLAPTLDLTLIDWDGDSSNKLLRYDNIHLSEFGAKRYAAVVREYIRQLVF